MILMIPQVNLKRSSMTESLLTDMAVEWQLHHVNLHVDTDVSLALVDITALVAFKILCTDSVDVSNMILQVCLV